MTRDHIVVATGRHRPDLMKIVVASTQPTVRHPSSLAFRRHLTAASTDRGL